jgi:hypothetical protein
MTLADFEALFTREALRPFQPEPGATGQVPMLEIRTATDVAVFVLALDGFNDWKARQAYLHELGLACAEDFPGVEVVRFGSEAWVRRFTDAEEAARGSRLVESYPDKDECIVVFGQLAGGTLRIAQAPLYRRASGAIERLGPWTVTTPTDTRMRSPLLESFWKWYRQGKRTTN